MTVTPEQLLDAAFALADGRQADVTIGEGGQDEFVHAAMKALAACVRELSLEIDGRLGMDSLVAAHAVLVDGVRFESSEGLKVFRAPRRPVMRREVERDENGRIIALVDTPV
jgi:hypothetical protein